jgi:hypothetical protein
MAASLEPLVDSGTSLLDILTQKDMDVDYKHTSMKNFLFARYRLVRQLSPSMLATFERAVTPAKEYFREAAPAP